VLTGVLVAILVVVLAIDVWLVLRLRPAAAVSFPAKPGIVICGDAGADRRHFAPRERDRPAS
jgi:hypothetical protein